MLVVSLIIIISHGMTHGLPGSFSRQVAHAGICNAVGFRAAFIRVRNDKVSVSFVSQVMALL